MPVTLDEVKAALLREAPVLLDGLHHLENLAREHHGPGARVVPSDIGFALMDGDALLTEMSLYILIKRPEDVPVFEYPGTHTGHDKPN